VSGAQTRSHSAAFSSRNSQSISGKQGVTTMFKFYRHYIRYAVAALATIGFALGRDLN